MDTPDFARAITQLLGLARRAATVMLCAEKNPDECHRRLIADYLLLQGHQVIHLLDGGERREHALHAHARRESAALVYDRGVSGELLRNTD